MMWLSGIVFETVADWQLARFRRDPANATAVMNRGLWRVTRVTLTTLASAACGWGFFLFALAAGAWWSLPGPLLLTWLLLGQFRGTRGGIGPRQASAAICRLRLENERPFSPPSPRK